MKTFSRVTYLQWRTLSNIYKIILFISHFCTFQLCFTFANWCLFVFLRALMKDCFTGCQKSLTGCIYFGGLRRGGDVDRQWPWDRTYCVCTNTALPVWEGVPSDRAQQPRRSTATGFLLRLTPPSLLLPSPSPNPPPSSFHCVFFFFFLQPRKSESLETCVWTDGLRPNRSPLSCMVISSPATKMVAFFSRQGPTPSFPPPPPPDKELFGHLLRAQQRLA